MLWQFPFTCWDVQDLDLSTMPHVALSAPFQTCIIDIQRAVDDCLSAESEACSASISKGGNDMDWQRSLFPDWVGTVATTAAGSVDAVVYWFDLELTPGLGNDYHGLPLKLSTGLR